MFTLQAIFSDNALFQHSSTLTVSGEGSIGQVINVKLILDGSVLQSSEGWVQDDWSFGVTIDTPEASFKLYDIEISDENQTVTLKNILFGELWLASGQSNMEMGNFTQIECDEYLSALRGKKLRFFHQDRNPGGQTGEYPYYPDYSMTGRWLNMEDNVDYLKRVSACATAFSNKLYDYLNSENDIPVGFVNSSVGGTRIEAWLPRSGFASNMVYNKEICDYLHRINAFPELMSWNKCGGENYQQVSCMFNQLIAPHTGVIFRGMLWYQGESNCGGENSHRIYATLLKALRESYKEIFAESEDSVFPIISSMIYPWTYSNREGECCIGYLNKAFSDLALESPDEYPFIPICDLKPVWAVRGNHPIHPIHKYELGERMALLCENSVYGRKVSNVQKLPAILKTHTVVGNAIQLTFSNVGDGLYIKGNKPRGLYICGKNGVYMPAECQIINENTMLVFAKGIQKPENVAYAVSSYEAETNIFAGEFPVTPFCTELENREKNISICLKPWLNTQNDSEFICNFSEDYRDCVRYPIWYAEEGCTVCFDSDFSITGRSVRVGGVDDNIGVSVYARKYNPLDLYNYSALNVSLMSQNDPEKAELVVSYADNNNDTIIIGECKKTHSLCWSDYYFDFSSLPNGEITKMKFSFKVRNGSLKYVNIDDLWLEEK